MKIKFVKKENPSCGKVGNASLKGSDPSMNFGAIIDDETIRRIAERNTKIAEIIYETRKEIEIEKKCERIARRMRK